MLLDGRLHVEGLAAPGAVGQPVQALKDFIR